MRPSLEWCKFECIFSHGQRVLARVGGRCSLQLQALRVRRASDEQCDVSCFFCPCIHHLCTPQELEDNSTGGCARVQGAGGAEEVEGWKDKDGNPADHNDDDGKAKDKDEVRRSLCHVICRWSICGVVCP
jgi:hypothetical protein